MDTFSQKFYPLSFYGQRQIRDLANDLGNEGIDPKTVLNLRPDATNDPLDFIREIPDNDLPFISPDAFTGGLGEEIVSEMTIQQLEIVGQKAALFLKEAIKQAARRAMLKGKPISRTKDYLDFSPAWQTNEPTTRK